MVEIASARVDEHLLNKLIVAKNVCLVLRSFLIVGSDFDQISFDALAHCPNLVDLTIRQVLTVIKNNQHKLLSVV